MLQIIYVKLNKGIIYKEFYSHFTFNPNTTPQLPKKGSGLVTPK